MGAVFLFNHFLDFALQDEQRHYASGGPLNSLGEEIAQLEYTLRSVRVLAGHRSADRGWMYAHLLGHLFDHHRLQLIDPVSQEIALALHNALADLEDSMLALLDVLHELDGRRVPFLHVIPDFLACAVIALEHTAVIGVETELRHI